MERNHRTKLFTLIELLIVIAIIAILASMLMPALGKARERGRSISCVSQLKTMANAAQLYSDENRDYTTSGLRYNSWAAKDFWWSVLIKTIKPTAKTLANNKDMTGDYKIFKCPSESRLTGANSVDFQYSHYGVNYRFTHYSAPVRKIISASKPTKVVMYMDSNIKNTYAIKADNQSSSRHESKKTNTAFLDGHAESRFISTDANKTEKLLEGFKNPCVATDGNDCKNNCK
jgi:prepilin-type N-terminal cleavage/methylation domain-containing protein/prepilin-type processing-associated H-X9-DG protein